MGLRITLGLLALVLIFTGCRNEPPYDKELPPGMPALELVTDPSQYPDFTSACSDMEGLKEGVANSLNYLSKPSSQGRYPILCKENGVNSQITHARAVESLKAFKALLDENPSPSQLEQTVRAQFDVYRSVGYDNNAIVLFTGYYTPILDASDTPNEEFKYPIYKPLPNLVKNDRGETQGLRQPDGTVTPCPDRAGLEKSGLLQGNELFWLSDPFDAYVAQIQGSAKLRMRNGSITTVGYAASSGHTYKSISKELVKDKKIKASQVSLQKLRALFKKKPKLLPEYVARNPRFIFFQVTGDRPHGSINEPVIPMRSVAVYKEIFPAACLTVISTELPCRSGSDVVLAPYCGFGLDQDTGGGFRAPGRCDVYMGIGDEAGDLAGRVRREGKLYYLLVKQGASAPGSAAPVPPPTASK